MTPRDAIPKTWTSHLADGVVALGLDVGTTDKGTSNPSVLTVSEEHTRRYLSRLVLSWKTSDPEVSRQMIIAVLDDLLETGCRPKCLVIDASNEVFFARDLRKKLLGRVMCILVRGGEKLKYKGEELDAKTLLGNLYTNHLEDGRIALPQGQWLSDDHRLVMRERGGFDNKTGKNGQHGDTFDSGKLALWGHLRSGGRSADGIRAIAVGGNDSPSRPGIQNRLLGMARDAHKTRFTT